MVKAHRSYGGIRYCATCYAREFKRRLCPGCANFARLPRKDDGAVCAACVRAKPCVRCRNVGRSIGKITEYGPVCNSCENYFRQARPCGECGKLSSHLSRYTRFAVDVQICGQCARLRLGTCSACRRHRLIVTDVPRKLCKHCAYESATVCQECEQSMPAGRRKTCESCYWSRTLRKRVAMDRAAFSAPRMADEFAAFGDWLLHTVGPNKAAITIHRYLPFFVEIERKWGAISHYANLLEHFGAEGLRRVRLPMRWLQQARQIVVDPEAREEDSEGRRIRAMIASLQAKPKLARLAQDYAATLDARRATGRTSVKSTRLALRPAISLLGLLEDGSAVPKQTDIDRYLKGSPGQRAAITGFVNFLNRNFGLALVARLFEKKSPTGALRKLERSLHELAQSIGTESSDEWVALALRVFHGINKRDAKSAQVRDADYRGVAGIDAEIRGRSLWVPKPEGYLKVAVRNRVIESDFRSVSEDQ